MLAKFEVRVLAISELLLFNAQKVTRSRYPGHTPFSKFLARDSIYAIARSLLTPVRPSVRLSVRLAVCHTGGSVKDGYS